jgi:hypothetical protein
VGTFNQSPSVAARMQSFDDSISQMLWPEKRPHDAVLGSKIPGMIDRTTMQSFIRVPTGYLPDAVQVAAGPLRSLMPWLFNADGVDIGPIPKGTPIDLIGNLNPLSDDPNPFARLAYKKKMLDLLLRFNGDIKKLPRNATDEQARAIMSNLAQPLLSASKCPDFISNRGHYFGTGYVEPGAPDSVGEPGLSDADKRALIEFLKTF